MQKIPKLTPVESSQMDSIGHNPETNEMAIRFKPSRKTPDKPGSLYVYQNITPETFTKFLAAESKGKFFGENIKPYATAFPYQRIDDAKTYTT